MIALTTAGEASPFLASVTDPAQQPIRPPLTAGIPESDASPLEAAFNQPWNDAQAQQDTAARAKGAAYQQKLDVALLDQEAFFKANPLKVFPGEDPQTARKGVLNHAFIHLHNGGRPVPAGAFGLELMRRRLADSLFDGRGADSEDAFHAEIVKDAQGRKDESAIGQHLLQAAGDSAVFASIEPERNPQSWQATREAIKAMPGYSARREADYLDAFREQEAAAKDLLAGFAPQLRAVWSAMQQGGAGTFSEVVKKGAAASWKSGSMLPGALAMIGEGAKQDAPATAFDLFKELPDDRRGDFMNALGLLARSLPKEERPAFFANLAKQGGRDTDSLAQGFGDALVMNLSKLPTPGGMGDTPEMTANKGKFRADYILRKNFASDVRRIEQADFSPLKSAFHAGAPGAFESGVYGIPGALASTAVAAIPAIGLPAMYLTMQGQAYDDIRQQLMRGPDALSDKDASRYADQWAPIAAIPQALLEKLEAGAWTGKLPGVTAVLNAAGNRIKNRLARFGGRAVAGGAYETTIEMAQQEIPPLVQDMAHALGQAVPDVQWTGKGGALDGFWTQTGTTLVTMFPLAMFGAAGGVSHEARAKAFAEATPTQRVAFGIPAAHSAAIDAAAAQGPSSLASAVDAALAARNPNSPEAKAAVEELQQQQAQHLALVEQAQLSGIVPFFKVNPDKSIAVIDGGTGEEIGTAATGADASRLAASHMQLVEENHAAVIARMGLMLDTMQTRAKDGSAGHQTGFEFHPFKKLSAADKIAAEPESIARVYAQLGITEAMSDPERSAILKNSFINGFSETEFRDGIARTVNTILGTGDIRTVFHEDTHALRRVAMQKGSFTRDEQIASLRALDAAMAKQGGRAAAKAFLPQTTADADISETQLDEAFSELMESEILRTATLGKGTAATTGQGHPPGVVSRYLDAAFQASPQAQGALHKLRGFVRFLRATYGEVFARTHAISKAIQKGDIKEGEHHAMLAKLLGTSDTVQADAHAVAVATEIIDGTEQTTFADGSVVDTPFSISKADEGDADYGVSKKGNKVEKSNPRAAEEFKMARRVETSGNVIFGGEGIHPESKLNEIISKVTEWGRNNGLFGEHKTPCLGGDVKITENAISEDLSHWSASEKTESIPSIPKLLKSAVFVQTETGPKGGFKSHILAAKLRINGKDYVVSIVVRENEGKLFYDHELVEKTEGGPAASQLTGADTRGRLAEESPSTGKVVRNAVGVKPEISFSISHNRQIDVLTQKSLALANDPAFRTAMMRRVAGNLGKLRSIPGRIKTAFGMDYKERAISDERAMKSLKKEAAFREAAARAEYEDAAKAKHEGILENPDLAKLKSNPVHEWLSIQGDPLHGRLMSPSAAIARGINFFDATKQGDFDGADGVSRTLFGGTLMPDQAAQELFDHHLIKEPTPDAMWDALKAEGRSVAKFRDYQQAAQADIRKGRLQAAEEARAWLDAAIKQQGLDHSTHAKIIRAFGMLDGILYALPPELRGRLGLHTATLAKLKTDEARLAYLEKTIDKADAVIEKWMVKEYGRLWEKLLERETVKNNGPGKKPKGKAGADVHALFATLRQAQQWDTTTTDAQAAALDAAVATGELDAEQEAHNILAASLIRLVGDWANADAARRAAAVENSTRVFDDGYYQFQFEKLQKKEARKLVREALKAATGKAGTAAERDSRVLADNKLGGWAKKIALSFGSFEQVLHVAFGEKSAEARSLVDAERAASDAATDSVFSKMDALDELFARLGGSRLDGEKLRWALAQKTLVIQGRQISELEAIAATLMWRQADGRRHMEGHKDENGEFSGEWHYGQDFVDECEAKLSAASLEVRIHLADQYAGEWATLNPVFRALNGIDLPQNANYSPLTVKPMVAASGQMVDPVTGAAYSGASTTPGSLRSRGTSISEPDFRDALQTYIAHVKQIEHYKAYAGFSAEAQALLNNRSLTNAVEAAGGKEAVNVLRLALDNFAQGGARDAAAHLGINKLLSAMTARAATTALVGRAGVLAVQSVQLMASFAEIPLGAFIKRFGMLLSGNLEWGAALRSPYIRRRRRQLPPAVRQAMEGLAASKPNAIKHHIARLGLLIGGADALFTAGTYAMIYDYQLMLATKEGMSAADAAAYAHIAAERATDRVAQPTRAGTRSIYEAQATNPLVKISWAFTSEPRQKLALSFFTLANPNASIGRKARALTTTWIVGGMVLALVRGAWRDMRDSDDDEWFDEKNWGAKRLALSALTGPLQGVPILGGMVEGGLHKIFGVYQPQGNLFSGAGQAAQAVKHVPDWFTGEREAYDAVKDAEAILSGMGVFNETLSAAASASHLARDLFGLVENATAD